MDILLLVKIVNSTSAASSQRGCPKGSEKEFRVQLPWRSEEVVQSGGGCI